MTSNINVYVYIYIMSRLINVSDDVYSDLTRLKKAKNASYSTVVRELLGSSRPAAKTDNWDELIAWIKERDKNFKGKREKIDHDLILYGASRARD